MARSKRVSWAIALVVVLALGPVAGWLAFGGLQGGRLASASEPSTCSVLGASTEEADGAHVPWVILVHTIAGERFERRDEGPVSDTEAEARQLVADLSPGQEVPCRYVAGAPSLVVYFERDPGPANLRLMGAGGLGLALLVVIGWAIARSRRS